MPNVIIFLYFSFLILILIAASVHKSAIILLPMLGMYSKQNKIITLPYTCLYFIKYHYFKYKEKRSKFEIDMSYLKDINHISEYDNIINICDNENNIIMLPIDYSF